MNRDKLKGYGIVTYKNGNEDNVEFKMSKLVGNLSFKQFKENKLNFILLTL